MRKTNMITIRNGKSHRVFKDSDGVLYYIMQGHVYRTLPENCIEANYEMKNEIERKENA